MKRNPDISIRIIDISEMDARYIALQGNKQDIISL